LQDSTIGNAVDFATWAQEVRRLAGERRAVILAHNYQVPWIQDVADHVGDSLALSRAAARSDAETIVFCGVHFMAETAKILAPDKTVLIPDPAAGCSLADSIDAGRLRAWKAEHPDAVVVAYVNTTAEVKAEADLCCTSSNAAEVVASVPAEREILFLPDFFLGQHVKRATGRDNIRLWLGECHVHAGIRPAELARGWRPSPMPSCWSTPSAAAPPRRSGWSATDSSPPAVPRSSRPVGCSPRPRGPARARYWSPPRPASSTSSARPTRR